MPWNVSSIKWESLFHETTEEILDVAIVTVAVFAVYSNHSRQTSAGSMSVARVEIRGFLLVPRSLETADEHVFSWFQRYLQGQFGSPFKKGVFVKNVQISHGKGYLKNHWHLMAAEGSRVSFLQGYGPLVGCSYTSV